MPAYESKNFFSNGWERFSKSYPRLFTEKNLFFLILLFSLFLKGVLVFSSQVPNPDGIAYINAAREFAQGNFQQGIKIYLMPFYPFLISCFHYVIPDWFRAAQAISCLSMVLAAIPLYKITKILFNQKAAIWSITAYSLAPHFNTIARKIIRDPLGLFMLSLAILFALKSLQDKKIKDFLFTSVFSILAFLSRSEFFLFPLFLFFFYGIILLIDRKQALSLGKGFVCFTIFFLFLGIVIWIMPDKSGIQILALIKVKTYFRHDFLNNYRHIYQLLKTLGDSLPNHFYTGNFAETARHYIWLVYVVALLEVAIILIFPTNLFPLCCNSFGKKYNRNHYFILAVIVLFSGSTYCYLLSKNFIQRRYFILPVFLLFPWIGNGLHQLYRKACSRGKKERIIALSLFFFLFLVLPIGKTLHSTGEPNPALKEAGLWIANHFTAPKNLKLLSNDRRIAFFAGWDKHAIIITDLQKINTYARKHKIRIVSLAISQKKKESVPILKGYTILKKFRDRKNLVIIAVEKT